MYDFLIVGAGFSGCVLAERIASRLNKRVLLIDSRNHIGGNAFDYYNEHGILVHAYGPHIFHTNSKKVFDYLSRFTEWRHYEHRVLANVDGCNVPIPINLDTLNKLYGMRMSSREAEAFLESVRVPVETVSNSEEAVISKVGRELYETFFKHYTKKQWDLWPSELDPGVCGRIPVRTNRDGRYFMDRYQAMPKNGYTEMFKKMVLHPNIHLMLQADFQSVKQLVPHQFLIYTGRIDAYFGYKFGKLPYRSLRFVFDTIDREYVQETGTVNYPNTFDFTRITEFKHLTGQVHRKTTIVYEYPSSDGSPYYPIPSKDSAQLYAKYKAEAEKLSGVWFTGRLGSYRYYNMDQVVGQALTLFETTIPHATVKEGIGAYD
ncbi:UDP-galactopyranose mutase [uncultured Paenibacillus sp.]|uniref:UDP-galactopyranose mutase n=1 Tax=uncultured Paenibacillus sp. TaxID=227322 RepID=UPI0028D7B253|nr:UDP-galactopyranose mutase [uncultured Paenibacillus sp.]